MSETDTLSLPERIRDATLIIEDNDHDALLVVGTNLPTLDDLPENTPEGAVIDFGSATYNDMYCYMCDRWDYTDGTLSMVFDPLNDPVGMLTIPDKHIEELIELSHVFGPSP